MPEAIIAAIRLLIPLSILRFPILGAILAILLDYYDFELLRFLGKGDLTYYQDLDKSLDLYYLSLEAYISTRWANRLARYTALLLFSYRLIGFLLFLTLRNPMLLVIFPNLFEFFYLFYLLFKRIFKKDPVLSFRGLLIILLILLIPKLIHEYFLHVNTAQSWNENKYIQMIFQDK